MALAEAHLAAEFNKAGEAPVVDSYVYVLCGDGCLQEGISGEASSLAGHLGLGKLIVCYDDNHITIDGSTELSFTEDVSKRYEAYGWHVQHVADGNNDVEAIEAAILAAKAVTDRPSMIKITTTIGFGSAKAGGDKVHGAPLGKDDLEFAKTKLGFDPKETFVVPEDVRAHYVAAAAAAAAHAKAHAATLEAYAAAHPAESAELKRRASGELPAGWEALLPRISADKAKDTKPAATRNLSGNVLNAIKDKMPELIGGSADLTPSNMTELKGVADFQHERSKRGSYAGRYIRFGVREHAMAAVCNGMASYGAVLPYCATFLNFIGYAQGAVRLSALSHFRVIYVATHDSIGLGEDGPTHQPVEMLESLRATPNMFVYRPADTNETSACYALAITKRDAPAVIALSRQVVPHVLASTIEKAMHGGYVAFDSAAPESADPSAAGAALVVASTGTEVSIAIEGAKKLAASSGARVVVASFPCLEVFEQQGEAYRKSVLPDGVPVLSIEASATRGWERYSHAQIGMHYFGLSAPAPDVYKRLKITGDEVAAKGAKMIAYYAGKWVAPVPANAVSFE
jgi:transketolase